jgi:hypothetical protein
MTYRLTCADCALNAKLPDFESGEQAFGRHANQYPNHRLDLKSLNCEQF